jgi:DNA-binding IclR family transcriptional regulator
MKIAKEMERHVEVVLKTLDILDCFQFQPSLTLKEIINCTGMTRSRAMRLTGTMVYRGYLLYESERKHFLLGTRVMTLSKAFETYNPLASIARPILSDLVQMTGELASLFVIDGLERVALARNKSPHEISYTVSEGQRMELYTGAAGKVLLSFATPDILEKVVSKKFLKKLTSMTICDPKQLKKELEIIRHRGYAVSHGERVPDVWSVAAPVFDHNKTVCSAIGITGPIYRIPKHVQANHIEMVIKKANELSIILGSRKFNKL